MKNDTTTTVLNLALAVMVILGVVFAILSITRTRELRNLTNRAAVANNALMGAQKLANDVAAYNAQVKSTDLERILKSVQAKPATK